MEHEESGTDSSPSLEPQVSDIDGTATLESQESELNWIVGGVKSSVRSLHLLSSLIVAGTLLNIVLTIVAFFVGGYSPDPDGYTTFTQNGAAALFLVPYAFVVVACLVLVWRFESRKRFSDAVFDELSDVLQRDLAASPQPSVQASIDRLVGVRERVLLREYRTVRLLPFMSGEHGPTTYVLFNVALMVVSLLGVFAFR